MERVVNGHPVEKNSVLYGRAATYIQLPALVAGKNHTGKYGQVLGHVGLSAGRGQRLDLFGRDGNFGNLDIRFGLSLFCH